jgi:hypothetical protein
MRRLPIALCALAVAGWAGSTAAGPAPRPGLDLGGLAGVYKVSFDNGLVTGETYRSENVLEIVPTGPAAAYIRTRLEFFNGHQCALWGVAHLEGQALVYRSPEPALAPGEEPCVLRITRQGGKVRFEDEGTCQSWCGARGGFSGVTFPASSRRPIRYMARLKASPQYRQALAEDR